ncbi:hypothetical protein F5890DRAFT_1554265 [Lentinula detonsa]|uniref:Uncharacterized protein n=1 Tax=Lentinula detonsa TaxID=2804962 RepID=A0AA38PYR0_9AGAR|nr:hypothetical protein F5890DRAFT_1554265 [Lentinula detonsa]
MIRNPSQLKRPPDHHQEMVSKLENDTHLNLQELEKRNHPNYKHQPQRKDQAKHEEDTRGTEGVSETFREFIDSSLLSHPDATDPELNQNTTILRNDHQNLSSEFNHYGKPRIAVALPGQYLQTPHSSDQNREGNLNIPFSGGPTTGSRIQLQQGDKGSSDDNHDQHHASPSITLPDTSQQMIFMGNSDTTFIGIMNPRINLGTSNPSAFSHFDPLNPDALGEPNVNISAGNRNSVFGPLPWNLSSMARKACAQHQTEAKSQATGHSQTSSNRQRCLPATSDARDFWSKSLLPRPSYNDPHQLFVDNSAPRSHKVSPTNLLPAYYSPYPENPLDSPLEPNHSSFSVNDFNNFNVSGGFNNNTCDNGSAAAVNSGDCSNVCDTAGSPLAYQYQQSPLHQNSSFPSTTNSSFPSTTNLFYNHRNLSDQHMSQSYDLSSYLDNTPGDGSCDPSSIAAMSSQSFDQASSSVYETDSGAFQRVFKWRATNSVIKPDMAARMTQTGSRTLPPRWL